MTSGLLYSSLYHTTTFGPRPSFILILVGIIHTTTEEAAAWKELHQFRAQVFSKPWTVPPAAEKRLKEEADGTRRQAEEKVRRKAEKERKAMKRKRRAEARAVNAATKSRRRTSDKENHVDH